MKILLNFWDYEAWQSLLQFTFICLMLLLGNTLRRKVAIFRKSLLPTAVLAGFIGLIIKEVVLAFDVKLSGLPILTESFFETITYHTIAIGFIALTLGAKQKTQFQPKEVKTGLIIVNSYLLQGVLGLVVTIILGFFMKEIASYAGILLPMGFGQGPGQANNIGLTLEQAGFVGGQTFGLAVSTLGFVFACIPGVWYLNYLQRRGQITRSNEYTTAEGTTTSVVEGSDEIPLTESIDKFTVQICLVAVTYFITWVIMAGLGSLLVKSSVSFVANDIHGLVWGFNFIFAIFAAFMVKKVIQILQKKRFMKRKYTNEYMMNRIAGIAFDFMIVASIIAIDIEMLNSWQMITALLLISIVGGVATFFYLHYITKRIYPQYPHAAMSSLYGTMTGTASTGIALLREVDPHFETPAADNLVTGSATAILFGAPIFLIIPYVKKGGVAVYITLFILLFLSIVYNFFLLKKKKQTK